MGNYFSATANLGDTNKFFMPWLIPRNDRNSIYRPNFFGKLAGRTKRQDEINENSIETIEQGNHLWKKTYVNKNHLLSLEKYFVKSYYLRCDLSQKFHKFNKSSIRIIR